MHDVNDDGISDGQEYEGYDITIVWIEDEETKSKDKKVYGDPLYAYKDQNDWGAVDALSVVRDTRNAITHATWVRMGKRKSRKS